MGKETELKFRADGETIARIRARYGDFETITMETTYYDTMDMKLSMHHWMLRRRLENGVSVCTFKRPAEDGSRYEWEVTCDSVMTGVMELCKKGADWELMRCAAGGLYPICAAKFTRLAKKLQTEEFTVELALDQGALLGGGKELPFAEVEVELKSGDRSKAEAFARSLAQEYLLQEEALSKVQRAMALAFGG